MTSQHQPPQEAVATLRIFDTLTAAFTLAYSDPLLLLRAASGGLLLLAATTAVSIMLPPNPFTLLLMMLAPVAAYSHFGINWYRAVLIGPEAVLRPALSWDRRHWQFFGFGLMVTSALLALGAVLSLALPVPPAVTAIGLLYVAARVSFLFPTIAVEEPYNIVYAWQHTKGQGARLTILLLLAGLPLMLAVSLMVNALFVAVTGFSLFDVAAMQTGGGAPSGDAMPLDISPLATLSLKMITEALSMAVLAVLYTIIALAFRTCTGWVPAGQNLPAAPEDEDSEGGGPWS